MPFYQRRVEARIVLPHFRKVKGERVLDLGCGDGIFSIELAKRGAQVLALDLGDTPLKRAVWRIRELHLQGRVDFIKAGATQIPCADNSFDKVLANCVIEHFADDVLALTEVHRVLKRGGLLVITTPGDYSQQSSVPFRIAKALFHGSGWWRNRLGSETVKRASSFQEYAELNIVPYDHARFGYSVTEIKEKLAAADMQILSLRGYFKTFGTIGIDFLEAFRAFEVAKKGDFGYTARHEWLHGLAFPVFYVLHYMDSLLPQSYPYMAIAVVAKKP